MNLIYCFYFIVCVLDCFKLNSFFIAADDSTNSATVTATIKPKDSNPTSETKVIEIKVNNEPKGSDNKSPDIKLEEAKPNTSEVQDSPKTKDATIATITVNIPNQNEQKIEIKNVDTTLPISSKDFSKGPAKGDEDHVDKDETFLMKIVRFIKSDFRFLVRVGAVLSSILTQMIPLNCLMTIRKDKSTRNLKSLNFITSAVSSLLWSLYATLTTNWILIFSNFPGAIINLVGIWMFSKYCTDHTQRLILNISSKVTLGLAVLLLILYFVFSFPTFLTVVGLFGGSLLAISYVSPLVSINEILQSRNTSTMPTEISIGNFICAFFMFCYGFIIWDLLVIAPNFLGVLSGFVQLVLLFLYPHTDRIIISEVEILEQPNNFKSILAADEEV